MKWRDLLGRPFKVHGFGADGMDCTTVAEEILSRLGKSPPATSPFRGPREHFAAERDADLYGTRPVDRVTGRDLRGYIASIEDSYDRIGTSCKDAKKEGDVVLAKDGMGRPAIMYVLVDERKGLFLTAEHQGGVRATRRYLLGEVAGVYRLKEEGA